MLLGIVVALVVANTSTRLPGNTATGSGPSLSTQQTEQREIGQAEALGRGGPVRGGADPLPESRSAGPGKCRRLVRIGLARIRGRGARRQQRKPAKRPIDRGEGRDRRSRAPGGSRVPGHDVLPREESGTGCCPVQPVHRGRSDMLPSSLLSSPTSRRRSPRTRRRSHLLRPQLRRAYPSS